MAQKLSVLQPSGEVLVLEVMPEMTVWEIKQQIKRGQAWDESSRKTTGVEIIVRDRLLDNGEKVVDAGLAADAVVSVVFKTNQVICFHQDAIVSLGGVIQPDLLPAVEIPSDETQIGENAFKACHTLAKVIIPNSVTHIGRSAFDCCSLLVCDPH